MEAILGLIILCFWWWGVGTLLNLFFRALRVGVSAAKAAVKSTKDGTSFKQNFNEETYQLGPLETKTHEIDVPLENNSSMKALQLQIRGLLNETQQTHNLQAVISLFDITTKDDNESPILSVLSEIQEPGSRVMMVRVPIGDVQSYAGFTKWVDLNRLFPDFMIGPKRGKRKIKAFIRLVGNNDEVLKGINYGLHSEELLIHAISSFEFTTTLKEPGYLEAEENYFKIRAAFVEFGVLMAFADGELHNSEAVAIKNWIAGQIDLENDEEKKEKLKALLNKTLKESFANAKTGMLSISKQINSFKQITSPANSFALLEFVFDIIGADGVIASAELKLAHSIADALDVSMEDVKSITDKTFLSVNNSINEGNSAENIIGITDDMTTPQIKALLNNEFKKWNGRIQALEDGEEKEKAQVMLNVISEARKKYG